MAESRCKHDLALSLCNYCSAVEAVKGKKIVKVQNTEVPSKGVGPVAIKFPTCNTEDCNTLVSLKGTREDRKAMRAGLKPVSFKRYCSDHGKIARQAFFNRLEAEKGERDNRYAAFQAAWEAASEAASQIKQKSDSTEAYLRLKSNSSSFGFWAKKNGHRGNDGLLNVGTTVPAKVKAFGKVLIGAGVDVTIQAEIELSA